MTLFASLALASPSSGPLGELPEGTQILQEQIHTEYARWELESPEGTFWLELTRDEGGEPVCSGNDIAVWVRTDLGTSESFDWEPLPRVVDLTCERLDDIELVLAEKPRDEEVVVEVLEGPQPAPQRPWAPRPLSLVVLVWLVALVLSLPRDRETIGAFLMALGVRVALSPRTVLLGGDAAYERLVSAVGHLPLDRYYGDTWPALMGPLNALLGRPPGLVHGIDLLLSALTVPLVVALAAQLGGTKAERYAAGVLLALSPLAVDLAGTETHFVLVAALQVAAVLGALREDRIGQVLAWSSIGLLAHLRPLQAIFCLLPLGLLLWRRRWLALGLASALVSWRAWQILDLPPGSGGGIVDYGRYLEPRFLMRMVAPGADAGDLALNPWVTPFMVPLLACGGLFATLRRERYRAAIVPSIAGMLALAPYAPKLEPLADPLRFQLPVQTWWVVLAGLGLGLVWTWRMRWLAPVLVLVVVAIGVARSPHPTWAWQAEYPFLLGEGRKLEPGTLVVMNAGQDPHGHMRDWLDWHTGAVWLGEDEWTPQPGDVVYRGTADRFEGVSWPFEGCELQVLAARPVSSATDGWVDLGAESVSLGFYEVVSCPD
ncbi:MAG: hypothetical protein GY913_23965 [Proteobacteria bacterium]|nr:hypothetical protein [Pseudomonadota bacterium]MCP4919971.1 hypothetical protein [Pseudomonadota bacterium]